LSAYGCFTEKLPGGTINTANSYNRQAEQYEARWQKYLKHTHRQLVNELRLAGDDIILDASCGTGLFARYLIKASLPFEKLVLNDIAADMQQKAITRFKDRLDIVFTAQPVQQLLFEPRSFTNIVCLNAFHNYPDQPRVMDHFQRILQPGGHLYLLDWNNSGAFRLVNWIIKQTTTEHIDSCSLHEIKQLCSDSGFHVTSEKEWYFRYWKLLFVKAQRL